MRWQDKLTKDELRHLRQTTKTLSLKSFRKNLEWHQQERERQIKEGKNFPDPCLECKMIAIKLGMFDPQTQLMVGATK